MLVSLAHHHTTHLRPLTRSYYYYYYYYSHTVI